MEEYVKELARQIYETYRGRRITLDRRGRPSYILVYNLARGLLELAYRYELDPKAIDWIAILDPDLSPEENLKLAYIAIAGGTVGARPPSDIADEYIRALGQQLSYLRDLLERPDLTQEEKSQIEEQIRQVEQELREADRKKKVRERRPPLPPKPAPPKPTPPPKPAPPPPPPPPAPPPVVPLQELRRRFEDAIRARVRVYRIDWSDLRARISCHRDYAEDVARVVGELGGKITERRRTDTLAVINADFTGVTPPPPAPRLSPEEERSLLWLNFSTVLRSWGYNPEDYRTDFESILRAVADRPLEEKQRAIERFLATLRPPPVREEMGAALDLLRREVERLRRELAEALRQLRRVTEVPTVAVSPDQFRATVLGSLPEPNVTSGPCPNVRKTVPHYSIQPTAECIEAMQWLGIHPALIEWLMSCPACRPFLPGGRLPPTEWAQHLFAKGVYPPLIKEWMINLAKKKEEAEGFTP